MRPALLLTMAFLLAPSAIAEEKEKDHYAGFGYSTRTGEFWFVYGMESEKKADEELTKRAEDKGLFHTVVIKNNYLSLARSKDGKTFGVGDADTPKGAEEKALAAARKVTKQRVSIEVTLHAAQGIGGDSYSCIAYSPSTGRFAAAVAKASQSEAEVEAVQKCMAADAKVVAVGKNKCCALALGKDKKVYGAAVAETEKEAQEMALEECRKKTSECRIVSTWAARK